MNRVQSEQEVEKTQTELRAVSAKFVENYEKFLAKHKQFVRVDREVMGAIEDTGATDFPRFSITLKQHIETVLQIRRSKEEASHSKWHIQVVRFLGALYPIAQISIGVTTAIADVFFFILFQF